MKKKKQIASPKQYHKRDATGQAGGVKKTVFVGMSGGVDSSVSAALLKYGTSLPAGRQGYDVVGVFIHTWHPDFLKCNEEEERRDAMRVAAFLEIPFLTFDFEDVYKKEVADYMISEYKAGRTPNPDVMCNKEVKFGAFLKKAISMGADYVATGHYARKREFPIINSQFSNKSQKIENLNIENLLKIENCKLKINKDTNHTKYDIPTTHYQLLTGIDSAKDQVYFLWTLKQEQLSKILFPVGHLNKTEVRKLARKFKLPVAEKKDSQGICFLGAVDLKDFLKHYIKPKKGKVLNEKGEEIGYHDGAVFYTLGERHGFTITKKSPNDGAYYVVEKDIKKNVLVVSKEKNISLIRANRRIVLNDVNWISGFSPKAYGLEPRAYSCQIRYHGEFLPCKIKTVGPERSRRIEVIFQKPILVASGQSCVFYNKDICLGGGVVK